MFSLNGQLGHQQVFLRGRKSQSAGGRHWLRPHWIWQLIGSPQSNPRPGLPSGSPNRPLPTLQPNSLHLVLFSSLYIVQQGCRDLASLATLASLSYLILPLLFCSINTRSGHQISWGWLGRLFPLLDEFDSYILTSLHPPPHHSQGVPKGMQAPQISNSHDG